MEYGTSRDKIYRLIKAGQLKARRIEGTYVLDVKAENNLQEILHKKHVYQKLVSDLSLERNIKPNSARKRIRRKQKIKNPMLS